jgi:hypothetical protein
MIDYSQILSQKYKGSEWTLNGDEYDGLTWLSKTTKPTKKELDDLWLEVKSNIKTEAAAKESARQALLSRLGITAEEAQLLLGGN